MSRVLVVDDDRDIRDLIRFALVEAGHEVAVAEDGLAALEASRSFAPDLILLDMRMPRMDGWTFAQAYRARREPQAKLVVVTAARDAAATASAIAADAWLAKPFSLDELYAVVGERAAPAPAP